MVRFDSYRAASRGNRASRNLVKKSTLGGRATLQAVTRVKLEQASKAAMWTPTRHVRFDERGWETGRRCCASARAHPRLYRHSSKNVGKDARPRGRPAT